MDTEVCSKLMLWNADVFVFKFFLNEAEVFCSFLIVKEHKKLNGGSR